MYSDSAEPLPLWARYRGRSLLELRQVRYRSLSFSGERKLAVFLRELGAIRGKIVTSIHGYGRSARCEGGAKHPFADLFKKGDLFLTCSDHMKRWFALKGWERETMIVHRCGVRVERFPVSKLKPNNSVVRLLSVGRLVEKKGI